MNVELGRKNRQEGKRKIMPLDQGLGENVAEKVNRTITQINNLISSKIDHINLSITSQGLVLQQIQANGALQLIKGCNCLNHRW